ncbi:hypothetical protein [Terrihabitans rhizophilus]|uniref:Uncharacterized protein n=1 Tax=Terrihabitans rhizophilus TaxID=3092662 RepID=A0ABU4RQV0_9HYPH|nr:hypothetical protein [Terrihabitans sp. PJ23]MDX6807216.1 hypothetical protein [Terrihabitans sp. PJ23]
MTRPSNLAPLRWLGGPLIWTAHFLLVYAAESLACTRGGGPLLHDAITAVATFAALLGLAVLFRINKRAADAPSREDFEMAEWIGLGLVAISALAVVWSGLAALLIPACVLPA